MATHKTTSIIISTLLGISAAAFNLTATAQPAQGATRDSSQQERGGNPQSNQNSKQHAQGAQQQRNQSPAPSAGHDKQAQPHNSGQTASPTRHTGPQAASQNPQQPGRGAGPDNRYHKGETLPTPYQGRKYYVSQPERHNLAAPGHGQRWVKVGADYVLITIATGLIIDLVLNH